MRIFYFLMACGMQLMVASAAQPYDPLEYVRIPQEYQPILLTLRDIMTPDEQGHPRHTFREVKAMMDPLKPVYDELTAVPKLYALIKDYEKKTKIYQQTFQGIKRDEESTMGIILRRASVTFHSIFVFYDYYQRRFPLDLQKIFFPFYTMRLLKAIFMMCDLIIDPNKEGFFYKDDYKREMPIVDLTDQLDQPFLTVFEQALQND